MLPSQQLPPLPVGVCNPHRNVSSVGGMPAHQRLETFGKGLKTPSRSGGRARARQGQEGRVSVPSSSLGSPDPARGRAREGDHEIRWAPCAHRRIHGASFAGRGLQPPPERVFRWRYARASTNGNVWEGVENPFPQRKWPGQWHDHSGPLPAAGMQPPSPVWGLLTQTGRVRSGTGASGCDA